VASGKADLFAEDSVRGLVSRIWSNREDGFSGSLTVLRAGGRPVAIDFGMRSRRTLHSWFPAYDPALSVYSPGTLLSLEVIAAAPALGISTIDLGKGRAFYKQRLANSAISLGEGTVPAAGWRATLRLGRLRSEEWIRGGPLFKPFRAVRRWCMQAASPIVKQ
jgi:CelD/BcsL family acetyltransferase involved in cellulose biosynthesis